MVKISSSERQKQLKTNLKQLRMNYLYYNKKRNINSTWQVYKRNKFSIYKTTNLSSRCSSQIKNSSFNL